MVSYTKLLFSTQVETDFFIYFFKTDIISHYININIAYRYWPKFSNLCITSLKYQHDEDIISFLPA